MKGKTQQAAGAASGMSERSVRNWSKGLPPVLRPVGNHPLQNSLSQRWFVL